MYFFCQTVIESQYESRPNKNHGAFSIHTENLVGEEKIHLCFLRTLNLKLSPGTFHGTCLQSYRGGRAMVERPAAVAICVHQREAGHNAMGIRAWLRLLAANGPIQGASVGRGGMGDQLVLIQHAALHQPLDPPNTPFSTGDAITVTFLCNESFTDKPLICHSF